MSGAKGERNVALARWCDCAVTYIRLKADRQQVWDELYAHMEDMLEALVSSGMSQKDAETLTVRSMGDFNEVGRELARIHKPFWGYVLGAAKVLFILAAACAIFTALELLFSGGFVHPAGADPYPWSAVTEGVIYPKCQETADGYSITIPRAVRTVNGTTYFTVNFKCLLPWAPAPDLSGFFIVDSGGNRYYDRASPDAAGEGRRFDFTSPPNSFEGFLTHSYECSISGLDGADWFELRYSRACRDLRLRVELGGDEK